MFEQLGIRAELMEAAAALGLEDATPLQTAAIPVLRRGGNLVLQASTGAGVTAAYALPILDRIAEGASDIAGPRVLVLVPTEDRATRKALQLGRLGGSVGLRAAALASGWHRRSDADIVVATPEGARAAVERSALKLDGLQALVLVDGNTQLGDAKEALVAVMASVPRDAQRVVAAADVTGEVERFVEAHVRKAMNVPARSAEGPVAPPAVTGNLEYVVVPEARKEAQLVALLEHRVSARPLVVTRSEFSAEALRHALALRGFANSGDEEAIRVVTAAEAAGAGNEISYDVPFDSETLARVHKAGGVVLVTPPELPHLRRMAAAAGFALKAERVQSSAGDALVEYRRMLRQAVHDEDIDAQMAVLDPLFDEFSPAEVAAALSALVRKRVPVRPSAGAPAQAQAAGAPKPASAEAGFVRLFVSVGSRDNIRPGDLVGALTGEAGITGDQVGKVDIKDTFTVVEIAAGAADRVIRAMNGTTMRGRSLRVDYDRKGAGGSRDARDGASRGRPMRDGPREFRGDREPRGERGARGVDRDREFRGPREYRGDRPPRRDH
jgi:ATP-dependent RNA helicase DeaD